MESEPAPSKQATPSTFAKSLNAAPFLPSPVASIPSPSQKKYVHSLNTAEAVKAAPFVPGNLKSSASEPVPNLTAGKNIHTPPFVSRSRADADDKIPSSTGQFAPQPHAASPASRAGYSAGRGSAGPPAGQGNSAGRGRGRGSVGSGTEGRGGGTGYYPGGVGSLMGPLAMGQSPGRQAQEQSGAAPYGGYAAGMPSSLPFSGPSSLPAQRAHEPYMAGPGRGQAAMRFMAEGLRQQLQLNSYMVQAQWSPEQAGRSQDDEVQGLPERVGHFHTLYPLEVPAADGNDRLSSALGLRTFVFKAISGLDGQAYALRRVCGKQVIPTAELLARARSTVESWAPVSNHPNMVGLRAAFVSADMEGGTPALFFAHDYHPGSLTLAQAHLIPSASASGVTSLRPAREPQLWSYLVQLTSVLRCVHNAGLSLRPGCLQPTKVLLTPFGRLRVSSVGVPDTLSPAQGDPLDPDDVQHMHRMELSAVGQLLLTLACAGLSPVPLLDVCAAHHSIELTRTLAALLASSEGGGLSSWRQLAAALADRTMEEMDGMAVMSCSLIGELDKECENGRLMRLMTKLGFVNERPDLEGDTQWSETGDRYLLKLFRDFVFHQASEDGAPMTDWGHVTEALNKLDAGVPEKILLMSRDEQSMLVVSYADLKVCVESAYAQVRDCAKRRNHNH